MPFQTLPDRGPLSEDSTRPVMGTVATLTANNLPGGSIAGIHMIGPLFPGTGIDLTPIGMTGCFAYVNPLITLSFAAASPSTPLPIPNDPALDGARIPVQAVLVAPGVNSFGVVTSDLCELIIGVL